MQSNCIERALAGGDQNCDPVLAALGNLTCLFASTSFDVNIDICLPMTCCPEEKYYNNSTSTNAIDTYVFDSFCGWYRRPRRRHQLTPTSQSACSCVADTHSHQENGTSSSVSSGAFAATVWESASFSICCWLLLGLWHNNRVYHPVKHRHNFPAKSQHICFDCGQHHYSIVFHNSVSMDSSTECDFDFAFQRNFVCGQCHNSGVVPAYDGSKYGERGTKAAKRWRNCWDWNGLRTRSCDLDECRHTCDTTATAPKVKQRYY